MVNFMLPLSTFCAASCCAESRGRATEHRMISVWSFARSVPRLVWAYHYCMHFFANMMCDVLFLSHHRVCVLTYCIKPPQLHHISTSSCFYDSMGKILLYKLDWSLLIGYAVLLFAPDITQQSCTCMYNKLMLYLSCHPMIKTNHGAKYPAIEPVRMSGMYRLIYNTWH